MYSVVFLPGAGPRGFAFGAPPLPLATSRCLPSGVTRTDVGYQAVGIKPSDRLRPGWRTSNTATALTLALATYNVFWSGDSARLLGVAPGGSLGWKAAQMVSRARPVAVSNTVTVLRLALAT